MMVTFMLPPSPAPAQPLPPELATQDDRIFRDWDRPDSPGCAVALIKEGRIIYSRGYGMADLDHRIPIYPVSTDQVSATVFHAASLAKPFTAFAVLLLDKWGRLSLYDEVRTYISELPDFGTPLLIRHLLEHTSGLRDQ